MAGRFSIRDSLSMSALPLGRRLAEGRNSLASEADQGRELRGHGRHRHSRHGRRSHYRVRFLVCLAASLLIMIAAAHIPFGDGWSRVGWYVVPKVETISVHLLESSEQAWKHGVPITRLEDEGSPSSPDGEPPHNESPEPAATKGAAAPPPVDRISGRRIFEAAHDMPQIVGGLGAYYIHIEYPEEALLAGVEGRLLLSFVVEKDGRTTGVEVIRTLHPACDSAAVRALRKTRFMPGRQNGELVPVRMHLPVRFKIVDRPDRLTASKTAES